MLDMECFSYLNRALESTLAPIVILATNRGVCQIRGTDIHSPHGVPVDLLDRLMVIRTLQYDVNHMAQILSVRAQTEDIQLTEATLALLAKIADQSSLRYACQLLTPMRVLAETNGRTAPNETDVSEAHLLFKDAKTSAKLLVEHKDKYLS